MRPNDGILITRDVTGAIKQLAAVSISLRHPEMLEPHGKFVLSNLFHYAGNTSRLMPQFMPRIYDNGYINNWQNWLTKFVFNVE